MKKLLYIFLLVFGLTFSMILASCQKEEVSSKIDNFQVEESYSAEIGNYFEVPIPSVTADGEQAQLSVSVTNGQDKIFIVENKILISNFAPYIITYKASKGDSYLEKTTTVTPIDTTAPTLKFWGVESNLYCNTVCDLSKISADDNSFESISVALKVVDADSNLEIPVTDNKFIAPNKSGVTIRIEATAIDSHNNIGKAQKEVYVVGRDNFGMLDSFNSPDIKNYYNGNMGSADRSEFSSVSSNDENEISGINGRALKVSVRNLNYGSFEGAFINLDKEKMEDAFTFDYLTFRIFIDEGTAVKNDKSTVSVKLRNSSAEGLSAQSGWQELVVYKKDYPTSGEFVFQATHWCGKDIFADFSIYFDQITGGYSKEIYVNESVNMYEALGVDKNNITSMTLQNGNGATFENGVFVAQSSGNYIIEAVIDKEPYSLTTLNYVICVYEKDKVNEFLYTTKDAVNGYVVKNLSGSLNLEINKVIENGNVEIGSTNQVLKLDVGESVSNGNYILDFSSVDAQKLFRFDYVTIRGYVDVARNGFHLGVVKNGERITETNLENVKGLFNYVIPKEYFEETLKLGFYDWTGNNDNQAKALYITSVVGGYSLVGSEQEVNLVEKTGFSATELNGTYFENAGGTKTVISDLTAFTPSEAGKIVLKLNVEGYAETEIEIDVVKLKSFNPLDNLSGEISEYKATNITGAIINAINVSIENGTAQIGLADKVLKLDVGGEVSNGNYILEFSNIDAQKLSHFDYVTVKGYVDVARTGFSLCAVKDGVRVDGTYIENVNGQFSIDIEKENFEDNFKVCFCDWTGNNANQAQALYITSVVGGYNDVTSGQEINIVEKTGFSATELAGTYFENVGGDKIVISDLTAFTPSEAGKIKLVLNVSGYLKDFAEIIVNL